MGQRWVNVGSSPLKTTWFWALQWPKTTQIPWSSASQRPKTMHIPWFGAPQLLQTMQIAWFGAPRQPPGPWAPWDLRGPPGVLGFADSSSKLDPASRSHRQQAPGPRSSGLGSGSSGEALEVRLTLRRRLGCFGRSRFYHRTRTSDTWMATAVTKRLLK